MNATTAEAQGIIDDAGIDLDITKAWGRFENAIAETALDLTNPALHSTEISRKFTALEEFGKKMQDLNGIPEETDDMAALSAS